MSEENPQRLGTGGFCVCPKCAYRAPHKRGTPCQEERCPKCKAKLLRENSYHHELWLAKQAGSS